MSLFPDDVKLAFAAVVLVAAAAAAAAAVDAVLLVTRSIWLVVKVNRMRPCHASRVELWALGFTADSHCRYCCQLQSNVGANNFRPLKLE